MQGQNLSSYGPFMADGSMRIIIINPIRSRIFRQHIPDSLMFTTRNDILKSGENLLAALIRLL